MNTKEERAVEEAALILIINEYTTALEHHHGYDTSNCRHEHPFIAWLEEEINKAGSLLDPSTEGHGAEVDKREDLQKAHDHLIKVYTAEGSEAVDNLIEEIKALI